METSTHPDHATTAEYVSPPVNLDLVAGIAEYLSQCRVVSLCNGTRISSLLDGIDVVCNLADAQREEVARKLTTLLNQTGGVYNVTAAIPSNWLNGHTP